MIAGETTVCSEVPANIKKSAYADAKSRTSRMSRAFEDMSLADDGNNGGNTHVSID